MKVAVVGSGYMGLVTGTCFSETGNDVWCVDTDEGKIKSLLRGILPIYEPGLEEKVHKNIAEGRLRFTTNISEALAYSEVCFITVGTPMKEDGGADLQYVLAAAKSIGQYMSRHMYIVDKSTVPVGTANLVRNTIQSELDKRKCNLTFDVVSNPEFLKEGTAVQDCMHPDRIIIGVDNEGAAGIMRELYEPYIKDANSLILMDIASAEMTKYSANAMLATKISFMNEISNICELVGADVNAVRQGIGSDHRIGFSFISPGCGYGGSCLPKDVKALIKTASKQGYRPRLLQSVEGVNADQKNVIVKKIKERFGEELHGRVFSIWGLAFKPNTSDMRESPAISIIKGLTEAGAMVKAYDPKAIDEAKRVYLKDNIHILYCNDKYKALENSDALILLTEWKEFCDPDFARIKKLLRHPVIFDGRNQYASSGIWEQGFDYYQIGVKPLLQRDRHVSNAIT